MDVFFFLVSADFISLFPLFVLHFRGKTFRDQSWFLHLVVLFKYFTE